MLTDHGQLSLPVSGRSHRRRSARYVPALVLGALLLVAGCGKKEPPDPIKEVKARIPAIEQGLNRKDIASLKKMGTDRFEANRFITDVFTHGVQGDVSLQLARIRYIPGEVRLTLNAFFGPEHSGGTKELIITFLGEKEKRNWKMDGYQLRDRRIPEQPNGNVFDSLPPDSGSSNPL